MTILILKILRSVIEFYFLIIDSIFEDFSQRFDLESVQFFHLAWPIHKNPIIHKKSNYFYIGFIVAFE